jgi:hypothetical protein
MKSETKKFTGKLKNTFEESAFVGIPFFFLDLFLKTKPSKAKLSKKKSFT